MVSVRGPRSATTKPRTDEASGPDIVGRRDEIMQAALELFAAKGYRATTMADIGLHLGIRGPSLYKHIVSKQELLVEIMQTTMDRLIGDYRAAIATSADIDVQLRRAVEAHVRFHSHHSEEAFVGTREINSLDEPHRRKIVAARSRYARGFRELIERGCAEGVFHVVSPRLAAYAILDMGMGVAVWYRPDATASADEIAYSHGDFALRLVGAV
jgi:AcrR family transcriptional regulator